jgi:alkanesulfonate monooxygenase SsuD/methylene tetrahydromethanopterin reductase-like flavin-dependent oxidoreductase (luciferase family)
VEFGAHLPLIDFGAPVTLAGLNAYARAAACLGFRALCANDHLLFGRSWLDGPTALAAVIEDSSDLALATTVSLPVVRGPVQLAKTLAAIDVLSQGRLVVGVGAGSSARDYAAAGVPFTERWPRFDEAIQALRALLRSDHDEFDGRYYSTRGIDLRPPPAQQPGPPLWVASWGSPAGLRRAAQHGDGWLASAYNTTPQRFRRNLDRLTDLLPAEGPKQRPFANAIATTWFCVTDDSRTAEHVFSDILSPMLNRPVDALRSLSLPIGPAELCARRITAFADAGADRMFLWPLGDEVKQLERFSEDVAPLVVRDK